MLKETLERFDEKFVQITYPFLGGMRLFWNTTPDEKRIDEMQKIDEIKQFIIEEIKLAMEEVRNIELATDIKTVAEIGKLNNKAETFGYAQAWMCKKLDKNISKYFEV